ncbi:MAG: ATP-binding protein [Saprospiraceae bacterium]|uniref:ATP-binding protein n=1 Tax=Candidatus Opimibacter skivensis TaxID=2982028 RepID=A0A9D7SXZ5_9BACT|nr:ATP-binding protein [Candidatus Opimibacter skivensis]
MDKPFVITIVGAESSGKTTLAMRLAEYFVCPWVPEYAREYLEGLERAYDEEDLGIMAAQQLAEILAVVNREPSTVSHESSDVRLEMVDPVLPNGLSETLKSLLVTRYSSLVIVDGGMMNMRMWARIKYKTSIPLVEEALENDVTDLYLLCRPLNEWEPDALREAPSIIDRVWIYNQYLEELSKSKINLEIVGSMENEKFNKAVTLIEKLFKTIIKPTA